ATISADAACRLAGPAAVMLDSPLRTSYATPAAPKSPSPSRALSWFASRLLIRSRRNGPSAAAPKPRCRLPVPLGDSSLLRPRDACRGLLGSGQVALPCSGHSLCPGSVLE